MSPLRGTRAVVVDVDNPKRQWLTVALTSPAAAFVEVGGRRVLERRYDAGGDSTLVLGRAHVEPGMLRIVAVVAQNDDGQRIALQVWGDETGLHDAFADVDALAASCRFRDCTHAHEPGCAVRAAVEEGRLDAARLRSYQKLRRELAYLARRQETSATYQEHQRSRQQGRLYRQVSRHNPKNRR